MSTEDEVRRLVNELRLIRAALERISPPPPRDPDTPMRGVTLFG